MRTTRFLNNLHCLTNHMLCYYTECPNPPSPANALINMDLLMHDQPVVTYKCDGDYNLFGFDQTTCQGDSTWTDLMFVCVCKYRKCTIKLFFIYNFQDIIL